MTVAPRLLPLVAVAVAGVLGVKALSSARMLPGLASTAVAAVPAPAPAPPPASRPPAPHAPPPHAAAPAAPAVCARGAADLARDAGLSPAELQTLQSLGARRGQLDARETALDSQLQLINAASMKLDARLKGLVDLKAQIQGLLGQADAQTAGQTDKLVTVYEKMKPRDAGALMAALDDKVRVPVAARIAETKPAILAAIMSQMGTVEGKKLTESLARRFQPNAALAQATSVAPPAPPAAPSASADDAGTAPAAPSAAPHKARKTARSTSTRSGRSARRAARAPAAAPAATAAKAPAPAAAAS